MGGTASRMDNNGRRTQQEDLLEMQKKKKKARKVSLLKPDGSQNKEINPRGQAKHMVV